MNHPQEHQKSAKPVDGSDEHFFTWLHISDIHFQAQESWRKRAVLKAFLRDLPVKLSETGWWPDAVMVSGDIAQSGKAQEYNQAKTFFEALGEKIKCPLSPDTWMIAPGNHDVDRDKVDDFEAQGRSLFYDQAKADTQLGKKATWKHFSKRQSAFINFTGKVFGKEHQWQTSRPWQIHQFEKHGHTIAVLCLNSAWACQDNSDPRNILVGEYQLRQALESAEGAHVRMALWHHPLEDLMEHDRGSCKALLRQQDTGCHFLLRGHLHDSEFNVTSAPSGGFIEMAAGALYQNPKYPLAVTLVRLDLNRGTGQARVLSYSPRDTGHWQWDHHLYRGMTEGIWNLTWRPDLVPRPTRNANPERNVAAKPAKPSWDGPLLPQAYAKYLKAEYGRVIDLLQAQADEAPLLKDYYVPLYTDWREPREEQPGEKAHKRNPFDMRLGELANQRRPITDLVQAGAEWRHFLIAGGPGSGKSTFLRYVALCVMGENPQRLPLVLPLRAFGDWLKNHKTEPKGDLLCQWAGEFLGEWGLTASELRARSGEGRVLWLLDGLDEIFDSGQRQRAAKCIGIWSQTTAGKDGVLVTTRPHVLQDPALLNALRCQKTRANVLPLDEEGQKVYLEHWFGAAYGSRDAQSAKTLRQGLWDALQAQAVIAPLRDNPLMLSAMALIYHRGHVLPHQRGALYKEVIEQLLNRRFGPQAGGNQNMVDDMMRGLQVVARHMHQEGRVRELNGEDFIRILVKGYFHHKKPTEQERLEMAEKARQLENHSGLLRAKGNPPDYEFVHFGLQEYLVACAFCEEEEPAEALKAYVDQDGWREVILLAAGILFDARVGNMGQRFLETLRSIAGEKERCKTLALVVRAAGEANSRAIPDGLRGALTEEALGELNKTEGAASIEARLQLGEGLGYLGDPRTDPANEMYWVALEPGFFTMGDDESQFDYEKPAHKVVLTQAYWMGRCPVTNGAYRQFMLDGGYREAKWWCQEGRNWLARKGEAFLKWFKDDVKPWYQSFGVDDQYLKEKDLTWENVKTWFHPGEQPLFWQDQRFNGLHQPVVGVNVYEAEAYARWLNHRLKKQSPSFLPQDFQVSLPTEARWEAAAKGKRGGIYPWGHPKPSDQHANFNSNANQTTPVGIFPLGSTDIGLLDMAGNVWEWCRDPWDANAYSQRKGETTNPPVNSDGPGRVLRGGSWDVVADGLRCATRLGGHAADRGNSVGFRLCGCRPEHDS